MAQTGSAQREPSMEEILASIRRIIEDSDTVRSPEDDKIIPEVAPVSSVGTDFSGGDGEVEAFRAGLDEPAAFARPDVEPSRPMLTELHKPEADAPARISEPSADVSPLRAVPSFDDAPAETQLRAQETVAPENEAEAEEPVSIDAIPEPVVSEPIEAEARSSIISDSTGRQVAAAFGELSEVFAASRRRSFDEMAEEMLRPMLQDWLDNNLPTLVERLVREEIERVARGSN